MNKPKNAFRKSGLGVVVRLLRLRANWWHLPPSKTFAKARWIRGAGEGVTGSLFEASRLARRAWEKNTGKSYNLKEFLAPISDDVMRLVNDADVQSDRQEA